MSVLIKGMEMPESCFQCWFLHVINPGYFYCFASGEEFEENFAIPKGRYKDCPLVEVKAPHGDLVEREAVLNTFSTHMNRTLHFTTIRDKVPTVIEADDTCTGDSCPIHFPDEPKYDPDEFFSAERSGKW